jgi:hypothetical protein
MKTRGEEVHLGGIAVLAHLLSVGSRRKEE